MTHPLLHEYLTATASRRGGSTALIMGEQRMTFAELEAESNRLAHALIAAGCAPGDRVCLLAPKAPETIAAMLAALKAGCAYVPIDIASPVSRVAAILAATEPAAVFVLPEAEVLHRELRAAVALPDCVAAVTPADARAQPDSPRRPRLHPDGAAHILFTSGSTGRPKGVVVTHSAVIAFVEWAVRQFDIRRGERLSGHPPLHFDLSTFDLYATLKTGAELHLLPPETLLPHQFARAIAEAELHQLFCVPSALAYISSYGALPDEGFPSLRRILWCGEVLPAPVLADWMRRHPGATFTNLYGPTEATIASSYHTVTGIPRDEVAPIPIGTACPGEELLVLGHDGSVLEEDQVGELCIAGAGLSPGYWRAPELTAAAFVADPRPGFKGRIYRTGDLARRDRDGLYHFLGRRDGQIKSRGHRIELAEIELAVGALPGVGECAVVGVPTDGFEGVQICCAVASHALRKPAPTELATALRKTLPRYMLPARWQIRSTALPRNANGKLDRVAIRSWFSETAEPAGAGAVCALGASSEPVAAR